MDFGIQVKVDPNGALPAIKRVEDGLTQAEKKAKEMSRAATAGMKAIGDAASHSSDDLEMEARMLERATGRARDYGAQIAALQRLHNQGRISNDEYIRTLEKMGVQFGHTAEQAERLRREQAQLAMNTIGFGNTPAKGGGIKAGINAAADFGGLSLGMAAVPAVGIGVANKVIDARQHHKDLADQMIVLENQARKFAEGGKSVNTVLDEQSKLAKQLHSTLGPTMALYDDVGDAVDELGLSQKQLMALTRTLGEGATLANKPLDAAGGIMTRLAGAMSQGKDGAREVGLILKQFPELGDALKKTWSTTDKGLVDMVTSGKKNLRDIIGVWTDYADEIHKAHDAQKITHADQKKMFEEQAARSGFGKSMGFMMDPSAANAQALANLQQHGFGALMGRTSSMDVWSETSDQLRRMREEWTATDNVMKGGLMFDLAAAATERLNTGLSDAVSTLDQIGTAVGQSQFMRVLGMRMDRDNEIKKAKQDLDDLNEAQKFGTYSTQQYAAKKKHLEEIITGVTKAQTAHRKELTLEQKLLEEIRGPQERAINELNELFVLWGKGTISLEEYNRATEKRRDLLLELGMIEVKSMTKGITVSPLPGVADLTMPVPKEESKSWLQGHIKGYVDESRKANYKLAQDAKKAAQETREAWGEAAGSIVGDFGRMAMEGDRTFGEMLEASLQKAAMLMLTMAAGSMGGGVGAQFASGLFGALGGGWNGFDHVISGRSGLEMPGFATGGDAMIRGKGPQDSIPVAFWGSAGESLHVRTPQQRMAEQEWARDAQRAMAGGGSTRVTNNVIVSSDPREVTAAMGTYEGKRTAVRLNRAGHWRR